MSKSVQHLASIKVHDEWETPMHIYAKACADYSIYPKLDICATDKNHVCLEWYTKEQDAFKQPWNQSFFMNPPYSDVKRWVQRAYTQHIRHKVNAMGLVYAKTDTKWWHEFVEGIAEVHFIKGRIKFFINGQQSKNSAPYPSCWIIWRV